MEEGKVSRQNDEEPGRNKTILTLNGDDSHRDSTETSTTTDDGLGPLAEDLEERALVEETGESLVLLALDKPTRVVGAFRRGVGDGSVPRVLRGRDRDGLALAVRDVGEPLDHLERTVEVRLSNEVGRSIAGHDLGASKLKVGGVDLATKNLVERLGTCQDEGVALDLDCTLTESDEVGSNTDRPGGDERNGEDALVVSARGRSGDETRTAERLDTETILETDDVGDPVPALAILLNLLGDDARALLGERGERVRGKIEILDTLERVSRVDERGLEEVEKLLSDAEAGTRVGREVDPRKAALLGDLGRLVEVVVLARAEGANLEGNVIGDDNNAAALGILGSD